MVCKSCGARLYKNAKFCAICGNKIEELEESTNIEVKEEVTTQEVVEPIKSEEATLISIPQTNLSETKTERKYSGKSITGFVLSLVGLFFAGIICGTLGIIFSSIALSNIKTKNYKGKGLAIAGLVISIVVLAISALSFMADIFYYLAYYAY